MGSSNYLTSWTPWLASAGSPLDIHGFNFTAPGPARCYPLLLWPDMLDCVIEGKDNLLFYTSWLL